MKKYKWLFITVLLLSTALPFQIVSANANSIEFGEKISGSITEEVPSQTYEIVLDKPGRIDIDFSSYISYVDLEVLDEYGEKAIDKRFSGGTAASPEKWFGSEYLKPGTYYVKVFDVHNNETGNYNLTVDFTDTKNNETETNNGSEIAQTLGFNQLVAGQISWNDQLDVYKLTVSAKEKFKINFTSYMSYVDLELVDEYGEKIIDKRLRGGSSTTPEKWSSSEELKPGTYFVKVFDTHNNETGVYNLAVDKDLGFSDVSSDHFYYYQLANLYDNKIINGYSDGTFKPYQELKRQHAIILLYNAMDLEVPKNYKEIANKFSDVGENHLYAKQVAAIYDAEIFRGKPNGKMGMLDELSREQMATVLVNAFDLKDTGKNYDVYLNNVSESHKNNVYILAQNEVTNQLDNFRPIESVNRAQFVVFLDKLWK